MSFGQMVHLMLFESGIASVVMWCLLAILVVGAFAALFGNRQAS